jgi:dTDP-4-amino-4,6-dideoxygalactose transaminase
MKSMIDLFRVFMDPEAAFALAALLTPDPQTGRLYIGQGERVEMFEAALKTMLGSDQGVLTTNSCTSALDLALHLCGVGGPRGDDRPSMLTQRDLVISTPMTCSATNSPIVTRGGRILWADVDPLTGLIDPASVDEQIERVMTRYGIVPSAIMAVDWGGQLVNYPALRQVAAREEIPIIQDAAHSFGARIESRPFLHPDAISPSGFPWHGDYACFSFQAIKALTTGDGGALICPDTATTERARLLRWYGLDRRSSQDFRCAQRIEEVGYKYHLNDIAATLGLVNLPSVDALLRDQRANAIVYGAELGGLDGVIVPYPFRGGDGSAADEDAPWWLFTLLVSDRDHFIGFLADRGIAASPVHARNDLHPGFRQAVLEERPLPGVDFFAAHEVAIPVGWWVTPPERDHIVTVVRQWSTMHGGQLVPPKQYAEV